MIAIVAKEKLQRGLGSSLRAPKFAPGTRAKAVTKRQGAEAEQQPRGRRRVRPGDAAGGGRGTASASDAVDAAKGASSKQQPGAEVKTGPAEGEDVASEERTACLRQAPVRRFRLKRKRKKVWEEENVSDMTPDLRRKLLEAAPQALRPLTIWELTDKQDSNLHERCESRRMVVQKKSWWSRKPA